MVASHVLRFPVLLRAAGGATVEPCRQKGRSPSRAQGHDGPTSAARAFLCTSCPDLLRDCRDRGQTPLNSSPGRSHSPIGSMRLGDIPRYLLRVWVAQPRACPLQAKCVPSAERAKGWSTLWTRQRPGCSARLHCEPERRSYA